MRVVFVGHASILVECNGIRILSDPWWAGPCFGAQWWIYPEPYLDPVRESRIDYIYVSHGHNDHFHPGTLTTLSRSATVLVSRHTDLAPHIRAMRFPVTEVSKDEEVHLGNGVMCRILPTHADDTLMAISGARETCLNLNDALHAAPRSVQDHFISLLKTLYPRIDYVFCGYGTASHFPNCYFVPAKDHAATAAKRQKFFNGSWARIIHGLQPHFGVPFAADVVLLERELFPLNEGVHNRERPTERFAKTYQPSQTKVLDIAPGFIVEDGAVVAEKVWQPLSSETLQATYREQIQKANSYRAVDAGSVQQVAALLEENIRLCHPYLSTFKGDYRCLIRPRNAETGIQVAKAAGAIRAKAVSLNRGRKTQYDLIYTTRLPYLKKSLTSQYGWEVLFVGSGGIFEYPARSKVRRGLHRELAVMMRKQSECPKPRYGQSGRLAYLTKQRIKRLLSLGEIDLYDLERWIVYAR